MRMACAGAALLVVGLAGCDLVTDPDERPPGSRLPAADFAAWLASPGTNPPAPELDVRGETGRIVLQGAIGTPVPCYDIEAWAAARAGTVDLTIVADALHVPCIAVVAAFGYEGAVRNLPPGPYHVRLSHVVRGHRQAVLEKDVVVD